MLVHPADCLQKLVKACMKLNMTDEELYKVERYFQNTNEQETITIDIKEIPETKIIDKALKEGQCEVSNVEKILEKILKKI